MLIFPAIDIYEGAAVRLIKGDYAQMTIYSDNPVEFAREFEAAGATCLHMVDLQGAKTGETPNLDIISGIARETSLFTEVGGGIRSIEVIEAYLGAGVDRVILGTAAVQNPAFLQEAVARFGEHVAVGVDVKDGCVAVKGWTETSALTLDEYCAQLQQLGVRTIICTDISKDGMLAGANQDLYAHLAATYDMNIVASGGVSSLEDVENLAALGLYGAIIGKAYYEGRVDLARVIALAAGETDGEKPSDAGSADVPVVSDTGLGDDDVARDAAAQDASEKACDAAAKLGADDVTYDAAGLIPAVMVDSVTHQVLMVAWMNRESLGMTLSTRIATFWSRSRQEIWVKGATSGNYLHVQSVTADCDADTLLVEVVPDGPACHTGSTSCFFRPLELAAQ